MILVRKVEGGDEKRSVPTFLSSVTIFYLTHSPEKDHDCFRTATACYGVNMIDLLAMSASTLIFDLHEK